MIHVYTEVPVADVRPGMVLDGLLDPDPRPLVVTDVTHHLATTEIHGRLPGVTTGRRIRVELPASAVAQRLPTDGELALVWGLVIEATQGKTDAVKAYDSVLDVEYVLGEPPFTLELAGRGPSDVRTVSEEPPPVDDEPS